MGAALQVAAAASSSNPPLRPVIAIMMRIPWLVDAHPELADLILRALKPPPTSSIANAPHLNTNARDFVPGDILQVAFNVLISTRPLHCRRRVNNHYSLDSPMSLCFVLRIGAEAEPRSDAGGKERNSAGTGTSHGTGPRRTGPADEEEMLSFDRWEIVIEGIESERAEPNELPMLEVDMDMLLSSLHSRVSPKTSPK
ncbi:hypothetical protein EDD22DRAFT_1023703 [Suillus occidentalis]|nr:hypothetical protein EDD22DRAFT_1023703 [Suillus occidentalis]